jgi:prepilin-type processing-associated H-X9-DG protein
LIGIIAVFVIIFASLVSFISNTRSNARSAACLSNNKQIGQALLQYAQDNDDTLPPARFSSDPVDADPAQRHNPWSVTILPFVKNIGTFACPSDFTPADMDASRWTWCPAGNLVTIDGEPHDRIDRSMIVIAGPERDQPAGAALGGVMTTNWGASITMMAHPAGTIMVTERYDKTSVCDPDSVHLHECDDYRSIKGGFDRESPCAERYLPSVQPGLNVQIASEYGLLKSSNQTSLDGAYHNGGFNSVFGDGHAKWNKYRSTFGFRGGLVEWTMWDRRLAR